MSIFNPAFWIASVERAVKTAAQAVILALGASDTGPVNLFELNGANALGFALGGFVLSILMSVASYEISSGGSPSLAPKSEVDSALVEFTSREGELNNA